MDVAEFLHQRYEECAAHARNRNTSDEERERELRRIEGQQRILARYHTAVVDQRMASLRFSVFLAMYEVVKELAREFADHPDYPPDGRPPCHSLTTLEPPAPLTTPGDR